MILIIIIKINRINYMKPLKLCQICNKKFKRLSSHLRHIHDMTIKQYYDCYLHDSRNGKCIECGNQCKFINIDKGYRLYCSTKCSNSSDAVQIKKKNTCMMNYGVDHPSKSRELNDKKIKSYINHYGVDNPSKSKKIQTLKRQTNIKNRGVAYPMQSENVKIKQRETCFEHHGTDYPMQSEIIRSKSKSSIQLKYDVSNISQVPQIKDQKSKTCMKHYGVLYPPQSKIIYDRIKKTTLKNHGVEYYFQTMESRKRSREMMIKAIEDGLKDGEKFSPRKGNNELSFISELQNHTDYFIDNNTKIDSLFPDGYIKELKIVIEFDEPHHKSTASQKHDKIKNDTYLLNNLHIFRCWEVDWFNDKEKCIKKFKEFAHKIGTLEINLKSL